jgi:hypothetical protein
MDTTISKDMERRHGPLAAVAVAVTDASSESERLRSETR